MAAQPMQLQAVSTANHHHHHSDGNNNGGHCDATNADASCVTVTLSLYVSLDVGLMVGRDTT